MQLRANCKAIINYKNSLLIGISQALAIIPGISRSGITISTGLLLGMSAKNAARFSFLLAIPAISGAGLITAIDMVDQPELISYNIMFAALASSSGNIFETSNIFGFLAIILAAVNIFGGFLVTQRMLQMYKKKKDKKK